MYQEAIGESIRLAGALAEFVDRTLVVLLKQAPDAALEKQNGTTSVADELLSVEKKQAIHTT
jgi:hypothetical protein